MKESTNNKEILAPKKKYSIFSTSNGLNSVTAKALNETKRYCSELIETKYDGSYESRALRAMIGTVIGNFDLLRSRLKNDYNNYRKKLKRKQNRDLKKATKLISGLERNVAMYKMALQRFNENLIDYDGYSIKEELSYSKENIVKFKERLRKIEEKNHEA